MNAAPRYQMASWNQKTGPGLTYSYRVRGTAIGS